MQTVEHAGDCELYSSAPTTQYCTTTTYLDAGQSTCCTGVARDVLFFDVTSIPTDSTVLNADLTMTAGTGPALGTPLTVEAHNLTVPYTTAASWSSSGTASWTGGTFDPAEAGSATFSAAPAAGAAIDLYPTALVQRWVRTTTANNGILLKANNETLHELVRMNASENGSGAPVLSVIYSPSAGEQPSYNLTSHRLNDRSHVHINNASGTFSLHATDLHIRGTGHDLVVDRIYNSVLINNGQFGSRWRMSIGPDVKLETYGDGSVGLFAAGGAPFLFQKTGSTWTAPPGLDATLTYNSTADTYKLTFNQSQEYYTFGLTNCSTCHYLQTDDTDRNGNNIHIAYNASGQATSLTDTQGRSVTVQYNAAGWINTITDANGPSTRTWSYGYTGSDLTTYTDPAGKVTNYSYDATHNLTEIDDPAQVGGARPTTTVAYLGHKVDYIHYTKNTTGGYYEFNFAYSSPEAAACNGHRRLQYPSHRRIGLPGWNHHVLRRHIG